MATVRPLFREAEKLGKVVPILPHPDDVIIDPERGVRFVEPFNEDEQRKLEETLTVRDLLIMQDALDQRRAVNDPLDASERPGSAFLFAALLNSLVPARYRLSDVDLTLRMMRAASLPLRKLLAMIFQGWRKLGARPKRGHLFPSLEQGRQHLEHLNDAIRELGHASE